MSDVAVVGGGMLGLTLALRLRQQGHAVTVFESAPAVGGLASADAIGDVRWDRFYHVILSSDTRLRALLDEVGLEDELQWSTTRTGFYVRGRWYSMSSALDFLRFPPLSLVDKGRLALTILRAARVRDVLALEELGAEEWLTRWSGRRTVDELWRPLLRSKLGEHTESASAAFIQAIIARLFGARRSGAGRERMGFVRGGYDRIVPALQRTVEAAGVTVVTASPVARVESGEDGVRVYRRGDDTPLDFHDVVLTVPCPVVSALCPQLTADERARLARVVYLGVVCPSLLLRRPLRGYYVTNITDAGFPFTGVIETTALTGTAPFAGHHLVYLPRYLSQANPLWSASDGELVESFVDGLRRMVPDLAPEDVVATRVSRARDVLAVSTRGYTRDALPPVETSVPGVFVVNSAQIAHGTLNVNETVALAERGAGLLAGRLGARGALAHA